MKVWGTQKKKNVEDKPTFKEVFSLEQRKKKAAEMKEKHSESDFLPTVIEGLNKISNVQKTYIQMALDPTVTVIFLIEYLRKMMNVKKNQSIFIQVGKKIVDMSSQIKILYEQNVEEDSFLYLRIKTEDTY